MRLTPGRGNNPSDVSLVNPPMFKPIFAALTFSCLFFGEATIAAKIRGPVVGGKLELTLANAERLDLMWIPPGQFVMGSPESEPGREVQEGPQTRVTLTRGFWLGRTTVTVGQWKEIMGIDLRGQLARRINDDTLYELGGKTQKLRDLMGWSRDADPSIYLANEDDGLPMYFVSWTDAMDFCGRLNERESAKGRLPADYQYSLPTEAQWEYACRAGSTTPTYAGPNSPPVLDRLAWYDQNSAVGYSGRRLGATRSGPREVGRKEPNAWGLCDMYGNLWQWCRDWYAPYPGDTTVDPLGPKSGNLRANRGGSFGSAANAERSAARAGNPPAEASAYRGFRIALVPIAPPSRAPD
jgi:formylglycine-generating enzyme required for sulfatase activity